MEKYACASSNRRRRMKAGDSSADCCEARTCSVINYAKSNFCNIFCNWEGSRGPW